MVDISFIIATKRDLDKYAHKVIDWINQHSAHYNFSYNITVCSPPEFRPIRNNINWIPDDKQTGSIYAYNLATHYSDSRYVFTLPDDHVFYFDINRLIPFLESSVFANRIYKLCAIASGGNTKIPSASRTLPYNVPNIKENECNILGYSFVSKDTIERYFGGFLFNPSFLQHWADNWTPYFLFRQKEPHIILEDSPFQGLYSEPSTFSENDDYDFKVFCSLIKNYEFQATRYCHHEISKLRYLYYYYLQPHELENASST